MKNKPLVFGAIFIILLSNIFFAVAQSAQHGINGYVFDAPGNISANGANATFWLYYSNGTLKNTIPLYDIVGESGLSGVSNWYAQDANNFKNPFWKEGDVVIIQIFKDSNRNVNTSVSLSSIGNNQAPSVYLPGFCGDSFCSTANENCSSCPGDCLMCGDGMCSSECGENSTGCPQDCPIVCSYCGNGVCDSGRNETSSTCIADCHCGNGLCDSLYNETILDCSEDCHCGDELCNYGENATSCANDCHCGNGICELNEDYDFCPEDCPYAICGNGLCDPGENLINCQQDCAGQGCNGNLKCEFGENNKNCPSDCLKLSCGNGKCEAELGETFGICPTDCPDLTLNLTQQISCGDKTCDSANGEDYKNCPYDCYKEKAKCGDKKCEYAENANNCCLDCNCPKDNSCVKNSCEKICCFLGVCKSELGICWYGYLFALITIIVILLLYFLYRK